MARSSFDFRPLCLGDLAISPPLVLGPMAGYTSLGFRLLCRRAGAGLVTGEMISARALEYGSPKTAILMATCEGERPVAFQIFGGEPDSMAEAARQCVAAGADLVDINMGCTVPKVRKAGAGVCLMADADRAVSVVQAVCRAVNVPVTVKYRAGMVAGDFSYLELGRRLQDAGAAALALHARTASAVFRGRADWTHIARLVAAVAVPVIGNGDLVSASGVIEVMSETGCAAAMVARGALGRPWLFSQCAQALRGEPISPEPTLGERLGVALCQGQMLALEIGDAAAAHVMRGHIAHYSRGLPMATVLRRRCQKMTSITELADIIEQYVALVRAEGLDRQAVEKRG